MSFASQRLVGERKLIEAESVFDVRVRKRLQKYRT